MALKGKLSNLCLFVVLVSVLVLAYEGWLWDQTHRYNDALKHTRYLDAAPYAGAHGLFAKAYAEQQRSNFQKARIIYSELEVGDDQALRVAALFNTANTYLQQAAAIDIDVDADLALPLIELAKSSYREVLQIDSEHWDSKYNLERALQLLPDTRDQRLMDLKGLSNPVRTITAADPEDNLP
jgi:mxaK protein